MGNPRKSVENGWKSIEIMPYTPRGAHFDARRWTDEMKEAFAAHCHVWWPCVQGQSAVKGLPNGAVLQAKLCLVPAREVEDLSHLRLSSS